MCKLLQIVHHANTVYRKNKRSSEEELGEVIKSFLEIREDKEKKKDKEAMIKLFEESKTVLKNLKRKLSESAKKQNDIYEACKKRLHRQEEVKEAENRFNRRIIQYLNATDQTDNSIQFQCENHLEDFYIYETEIYAKAHLIKKELEDRVLNSLKEWCEEHNHMLKRINSPLLFELLCCEFIEALEEKNELLAVEILRKGLIKLVLSKEQKREVEKLAMMILKPQYNATFYFIVLKNSFIVAVNKIYHISFETELDKVFAAGVSMLKSVCCNKNLGKMPTQCPTCHPLIHEFGKSLPMTSRKESNLKCRINNSLINEKNYPVILPNGQIYSISGLMQAERDEYYFCPITNNLFEKERARKVFLP